VSEDLSCNISCSCDFDAGTDHFQWAPVLVLNQVSDESFACLRVELIAWIGDTGAESNKVLRILDTVRSKFLSGLGVGDKFNIHVSFRLRKNLLVSLVISRLILSVSSLKSILSI